MEIISLDDTQPSFIIDENPRNMTTEEEEISPAKKGTARKKSKKRSLNKSKGQSSQCMVQSDPGAIDLGEFFSGNRSEFSLTHDEKEENKLEEVNDLVTEEPPKKKRRESNKMRKRSLKRKNSGDGSIIVIGSDVEEDGAESDDVIVLSDDEVELVGVSGGRSVGTIGGEFARSMRFAVPSNVEHIPNWKQFNKKNRFNHNKCLRNSINQMNSRIDKGMENRRFGAAAEMQPKEPATGKLRPVVIDGSNVAFGHGCQENFSSRGLEICVDYFRSRGHEVKVFVPQFRRRHPGTSDTHILDRLEKEKIVIFTPSRRVNGKRVVSYDDRYIVEYATKIGGVIVSRDNYQDLVSENEEWTETINNRLLMFTWVDDLIMFPHDPLGRGGPDLNSFLRFPDHNKT